MTPAPSFISTICRRTRTWSHLIETSYEGLNQMRVRLDIELTDEEVARLQRKAILHGYSRENPRKAWTDKEKKEAARYGIEALVRDYLRE